MQGEMLSHLTTIVLALTLKLKLLGSVAIQQNKGTWLLSMCYFVTYP